MGSALTVIVAGLVFSLSRGAWLGALAGFFVVVGTRGKMKFMLRSLIVLVPMVVIFWNLLPAEKREYASSFDPNRQNISLRYQSIDFARRVFEDNPVFGVGVGLRKEFDATNIFWVTLAETGIQGLISFAMIHIMCLTMIAKTQRFVARTDPRFSILVLGGALLFAKVIHGIVDHYWSRGAILIAWGCCGMATTIYYREQDRLAKLNIQIMKSHRLKSRGRATKSVSPAT
jgi:O-antigen ligase